MEQICNTMEGSILHSAKTYPGLSSPLPSLKHGLTAVTQQESTVNLGDTCLRVMGRRGFLKVSLFRVQTTRRAFFPTFPQSKQRSGTWLHTHKPPHRIDDVYPSFSTKWSYAEAFSYNLLCTVETSGSETLTHIQTTMWFVWNMDLNYKPGKSLRVSILHKLWGNGWNVDQEWWGLRSMVTDWLVASLGGCGGLD